MLDTRLTAYLKIKPELGERQLSVLNALKELECATNTQIAKHLNLPINCVTGRTNELRKKGLVIYSHTSWDPLTRFKANYWICRGVKNE